MRRPLCLVTLAFVVCIYLLLGIWSKPAFISDFESGQKLSVIGKVYQKEFKNDQWTLYLKSVTLCNDSKSQTTTIKKTGVVCYMTKDTLESEIPDIGSSVLVQGSFDLFPLPTNPGEFDASLYYEILGYTFRLNSSECLRENKTFFGYGQKLYIIRQKACSIYDHILNEKDSGVMKALIFGEKSSLEADLKDLYQRNGIIHILAISGLHISFIGMGFYKILKKIGLSNKIAAFAGVFFIIQYGLMVGMSPSALRAIFMFILQLLARQLGRTYDMLTAMCVAALLVLIEQPLYVYFGGFQLSFGAIMGLGIMEPFQDFQENSRKKNRYKDFLFRIKQSFLGSLGVMICTIPFLLYSYYEISPFAILLNLFVIPLSAPILGTGIACLPIGAVSLLAGRGVGLLVHTLLWVMEKGCMTTDWLPFRTLVVGQPPAWKIVVYYLVVLIVLCGNAILIKKKASEGKASDKKKSYKRNSQAICLFLFLLNIMVLIANWQKLIPFYQEPLITFIDVGQGESILIQSPSGKNYMIDGGSNSTKQVGTRKILPCLKYYGISEIEYVFITHPDADHINGILELLDVQKEETLKIKNLVVSGISEPDENYLTLVKTAIDNKTEIRYMSKGDSLTDSCIKFFCLHPEKGFASEDRNEYSLVLEFSYGSFRGLFTGDISSKQETEILGLLKGRYQFLKAAHHGSKYSNSEELVEKVSPASAVISCGIHNTYGHPGQRVMDLFYEHDIPVFLTMKQGAIQYFIKKNTRAFYVRTFTDR